MVKSKPIIVIATVKSFHIKNAEIFKNRHHDFDIKVINQKGDLTYEKLNKLKPIFVFFPHWSWIIPREIYENYKCVVFHCSDLPFGRGGSPLQNLLSRGIYTTQISALKVCEGLDAGDIYLKKPVDISTGSADDIFMKISEIIFKEMMPAFLNGNLQPIKQEGKVTIFKRRTPEQSLIPENLTLVQLYDYIRMLDGEGYPKAFKIIDNKKFTFSNANIENNKLTAKIEIVEIENE